MSIMGGAKMRKRLSIQPVGEPLTFSDYVGMVFEEPIVLHSISKRLNFPHWIEHLYSFLAYASKELPSYSCEINRFDELKFEIIKGLNNHGFSQQANEILDVKSEHELNRVIIRQYTEETELYYKVNETLRKCHNYQTNHEVAEGNVEQYESSLAAWILQLNSAIRKEPHYKEKSYRGTFLSNEDIAKYVEQEIFVWGSFISASKSKAACLGGNVLFEIFTESAMSLNDKRFPRDISQLSDFPEEEEVLYPIACAYRVRYIKKEKNITTIGIVTVDHN